MVFELFLIIPAALFGIVTGNTDLYSFGSALAMLGMGMTIVGILGFGVKEKLVGTNPDSYIAPKDLKAINSDETQVYPAVPEGEMTGLGLGFIPNCIIAGMLAFTLGLYLMGV